METTRHFTASIYVVNDDATVLHRHDRLDMWLPPGGHLERDELPHRAALREAVEETGLDVTLVQSPDGTQSETARPIPRPAHVMLEDINRAGDHVGHQHIDLIYYGRSRSRSIDPVGAGELAADRWEWVDRETLQTASRFDPDVVEHAVAAIDAVAANAGR